VASPISQWDRALKHAAALVIVVLGATATFLLNALGPIALVIIWLFAALGIATVYALKFKKDLAVSQVREPSARSEPATAEPAKPVPLFSVTLKADQEDEYVYHFKEFDDPATIEVAAESPYTVAFAIFVMSEDDFETYNQGRGNWEYIAGNEKTSGYHEVVKVPFGGVWYFVVEKPEDLRWLVVNLKVTLLKDSQ